MLLDQLHLGGWSFPHHGVRHAAGYSGL